MELLKTQLRPRQIVTRQAFENAIRVNAAIGGSSNFVLHMLAIAGRVGVPLTLDDFDRVGHDLPLLVNIQPSGKFLMEDFYYAGGLPAVMKEIAHLLDGTAITANGKTVEENIAGAPCWNRDVECAAFRERNTAACAVDGVDEIDFQREANVASAHARIAAPAHARAE